MVPDFDVAPDDARPRSWADAFPWLAGASDLSGVRWWNDAIDSDDPVTRRSHLAAISALAMERLTRWTIGQIFPGLAPDLDLLKLKMPTRAINALARFDCATSSQLMAVSLDDMMGWRQVGVGTVDAILQTLADISLSGATPAVTVPAIDGAPSAERPFDTPAVAGWVSSMVDDLNLIAGWYGTVGLPSQPLLAGQVRPGAPHDVVKARQRLEALTAGDILDESELNLDVAGLFDGALRRLDPRAVEVLRARLFADQAVTLDQLGQVHQLTRERIRQIEGKARGVMLTVISDTGPLATVAGSARDLIGTVRPLDDLLELMPALGREVELVGQPAWRVLDRLDDAYEIEDGWCVVPTMTAAKSVTQTRLQEAADQYGVVRLDEIDLVESTHVERLPELNASWLTHCGYVISADFVVTRTSSVGDYAAAVLAIEGAPLGVQEIVDRFVFERSARSLGNALAADDRFERVDRDRWALKEWGMEAYAGIRSIIRELVAQGGGRARLNDVVEYITAKYSVSGNSVIAYAAAAPFMTRDGIVQLDTGDRAARKTPEHTRRLFRRPDAWAYRVRITTDHLRGSGSVAPVAIATILGLQAGQTIQLESPLGPQAIAWTGIQPSFGTIRRFLMDEDVSADTEAFLVIHDDGTFSFEQARDQVDNPLVDALSLIGAEPAVGREVSRVALAYAIGLPKDSQIASIIGGYRARGDDDIAELLLSVRDDLETGLAPAQRRHSTDVDDILDLL